MTDIKLYGAPWCPDCKRSKKFLAEHRVPFDWIDIDQDGEARRYVEELQKGGRSIPTIVFRDGSYLIEPSDDELARKLGMKLEASRSSYDVAIVGGGPAGLAAALYAAREGIDAVVVDRSALGGQAAITDRIENYPGFPDGIGGAELMERFVAQARGYGVELVPAVEVRTLNTEGTSIVLRLGNDQEVCANAALIATGSRYRRLNVPGEDTLIGAGVHFCATCDGPFYRGADELLVIGGGNSGVEEGLFLSRFAKRVRIVARGPELKASKLLQDKVRRRPEFIIHTNTEIIELRGEGKLREVVARDLVTGERHVWHPAAAFVFIGLDPNTAFLGGFVDLDRWGFVVTDASLQTSVPGVFAAGDVRRGSTKQLGSAVGEGIAAILQVREHLRRSRQLAAVAVNE